MEVIEFEGDLSASGRKMIVNFNSIRSGICMTIVASLMSAVTIFIAVNLEPIAWIMIPCYVVGILLAFFSKEDKKTTDKIATKHIIIGDKTVSAECEVAYTEKEIEDIKKIVDYGDFYKIFFYFPNTDESFICQKDLITRGSIEEFEERFADKIIRKPLKKK